MKKRKTVPLLIHSKVGKHSSEVDLYTLWKCLFRLTYVIHKFDFTFTTDKSLSVISFSASTRFHFLFKCHFFFSAFCFLQQQLLVTCTGIYSNLLLYR